MGIYVNDLRELIVRPALEQLNEWSQSAEDLLLGTAAQESKLGFRMRSGHDNGQGLYNISARAHLKIWDEYLVKDPELASRLRGLASQHQFLKSPHTELIYNLSYASGVAWMIYKRCHLKLPDKASVHELANFWLNYYRAKDGTNGVDQNINHEIIGNPECTIDTFVRNYRSLVLCENKNLAA